ELDMARSFLARAGHGDRAHYELGDAVEIVDEYDGPFDVVLIDHDKPRYADGFDKAREKIPEGGVVVADNMTRGPIDLDTLIAYFADDDPLPEDASEGTEGIANYVEHVRADPAFESFILPVGSGICLSTRVAPREG
ncbi:MAG: O-methyltransferase, partial [Halolamina sp.]